MADSDDNEEDMDDEFWRDGKSENPSASSETTIPSSSSLSHHLVIRGELDDHFVKLGLGAVRDKIHSEYFYPQRASR